MMNDGLEALIAKRPELMSCREAIAQTLCVLVKCFENSGKLLLCGNGGSASDCEHIVGELMKGFLLKREIPGSQKKELGEIGDFLQGALPAISLTGHPSLASAVINDNRGDMVFAQQVYGLGNAGDVLWAISTSGNSKNVVNAVNVARLKKMKTIGLTGEEGGILAKECDLCIRVPADSVVAIQELHLPVYHALCAGLEHHFFSCAKSLCQSVKT